jgi:glycosyltransferase involved in cell wall biosynthesis
MAALQPIRVLYLDHTAQLSGGELALMRLLGALDRARVTPIVVLAEDGPLRALLQREAVETYVVPLSEKVRHVRKDSLGFAGLLGQFRAVGTMVAYARRISQAARQYRADLIYTNSLKSDLYGALAGRLAQMPVIWHVHDRIERDYLPAATVWLVRLLARYLPECVVGNSSATLKSLRLGDARPACVIAPGLRAADFEPGASGSASNKVPRIAIVGRITPWKGQDLFLEAAARIRRKGIAAHFLIVGAPMFGSQDVAFEQQLRNFVVRNGMVDCVEFTGFVDVPPLLRTLDVLVHASRIPEPFGQVIIEGMAAELPVVAIDSEATRDIVESGRNGLLVPAGDAAAMAQSLAELVTQPVLARQLGIAARIRVMENFTVEKSARLSEDLYLQVLARRRA